MRNGPLEVALLLLIALAGCRGEGEGGANAASPAPPSGSGAAVQTATLTGLYEGGSGERRNQLCMIERDGRGTSFGFVTWGPGNRNCSGSGVATRTGDRLQLKLEGDESCAFDARIQGTRVTFPNSSPAECQRYYCGQGAQLADATFDKIGGDEQAAMRAADLVGDPLCGG